jgi:DNA-binding NtrC family response regulator
VRRADSHPCESANAAGRIQLQTKDARLAGSAILVVEDASIIAMELELILRAAGAAEVIIATCVEDGLAHLVSGLRFDLAVIGVFLDASAVEMALAIAERGCPVVLITAQPDGLVLTSPLDRAKRVRKPYSPADVVEAVARSLRHAGRE